MSGVRRQVDRLTGEVARLNRSGLQPEEYFAEVSTRLRRVIEYEAACWHTIDPQTRLITGEAPKELLAAGIYTPETAVQAATVIFESEYSRPDFNTFAELASRRLPVGILGKTTKGHPELSARYRETLAPSDIPHEMRASFVTKGRCWGAVHVARRSHSRDFADEDGAVLAAVSPLIAEGIRTSLRFDAARRPEDPTAPGLVVVNAQNEIELVTAPAEELLDEMRSESIGGSGLPPGPLVGLVESVRRQTGGPTPYNDAVAVPGRTSWITMHASLPKGPADGQVAVVVARTPSPETTAVRLETYGVTRREREIAKLLAQGLGYTQIAEKLVISAYTVQDHVRSLFEKTGVASRQELVARIFLHDYLPRVMQGAHLTVDGNFVPAD